MHRLSQDLAAQSLGLLVHVMSATIQSSSTRRHGRALLVLVCINFLLAARGLQPPEVCQTTRSTMSALSIFSHELSACTMGLARNQKSPGNPVLICSAPGFFTLPLPAAGNPQFP